MSDATPLAEIVARAERLVSTSTADATSIAWIESRDGEVVAGARARRAESALRRSVFLRVRVGGRTGRARAESELPADLQRSLRTAQADARCAEPTPDWNVAATCREPASLTALADPAIAELEPHAAQAELQGRSGRRSTLRLRWREMRLVVAASFHPTRSASLTEATFEVASGRRPGSGFAARSARSLKALEIDSLLDAASRLESSEVAQELPTAPVPALLASEAVAVLVDAFARHALNGARRLGGGKAPDLRLPESLRLIDEPLDPRGLPLPFDFDGCAKRSRTFVERGWVVSAATDLDLAARLGLEPTAHALAADDAWPDHLALVPGTADDQALRIAAAGGLRIGSLAQLAVEPGDSMPFRVVARNVRRIASDGTLGAALAPLAWSGSLRDLFADLRGIGAEPRAWAPRASSTGAVLAPAIVLGEVGGLEPATL